MSCDIWSHQLLLRGLLHLYFGCMYPWGTVVVFLPLGSLPEGACGERVVAYMWQLCFARFHSQLSLTSLHAIDTSLYNAGGRSFDLEEL